MHILRRLLYNCCSQTYLKYYRSSRPPSMLPLVPADDDSLSEGDESDNVDLTDGSSYDTDGSEWNEGPFSINIFSTAALPNISKVPLRPLNTLSRPITLRSLDITAFQLADLLYGSETLLLPFE